MRSCWTSLTRVKNPCHVRGFMSSPFASSSAGLSRRQMLRRMCGGFGAVSAEDVRRLLAHAEQPGSAAAETPSPAAPAGEASAKAGAKDERAPEPDPLKGRNQSVVAQSEPSKPAPSPASAPRHGGALPK